MQHNMHEHHKQEHNKMIVLGGWCLLIFAALFIGLPILISFFSTGQPLIYSLEDQGLFKVAGGSDAINKLLSLVAISPLFIIPGTVATYYAFHEKYEANMRVGMYFGSLGAGFLSLSLMLFPSFNWFMASYLPTFSAQTQQLAIILLKGMDSYFSIYVGDVLGLGCLLVWVFTTSIVAIKSDVLPALVGWVSLILAFIIAIILLLRYTGFIAEVYVFLQTGILFAIWFVIFGVCLISLRRDY